MKQVKRILMFLLCVLLVPAVSFAEGPIEVERAVNFTVSYMDGENPLTGARFDVYKVADVDKNAKMYVTDEFKPFYVDLNDMDQEGWQKLAVRLKGEAQLNLEPMQSAETKANGDASFILKPGLYLVIGNALRTDDDTAYVCDPFMAFLPGRDTERNEWSYSVTAKPKNTHPVPIRKILKVWDPEYKDECEDYKEVKVIVLCDGEYWRTVTLTKENNWCYEWPDELDPEHKHDWTFSEIKVEGYEPEYEIIGSTVRIYNVREPGYIPPMPINDLSIEKKISGKPPEKTKFTFTLKAKNADSPMPEGSINGVKEISITGAGTNQFGKFEFTEPGTYIYTVSEKNDAVKGYTYDSTIYTVTCYVTAEEDGMSAKATIKNDKGISVRSIVFNNKYSDGKLPQTGLLWWPVPVLLAAGLLFVLMGAMRRRNSKNEE